MMVCFGLISRRCYDGDKGKRVELNVDGFSGGRNNGYYQSGKTKELLVDLMFVVI